MRTLLLAVLFVLLGSAAFAQTTTSTSSSTSTSTSTSSSTSTTSTSLLALTGDSGVLDTLASAAATNNRIQVDGRANLLVYLTGTAGTATCQCQQSGDGLNWTNLGSTSSSLGVLCNVNWPTAFYRVNCATCSGGCSLVPKYKAVRLK